MKKWLLALCAVLIVSSPALAVTWPNEPAGSTPLMDCDFTGAPGTCGILDVYNSTFRDSDTTAPISPPGVSRSTIFAGNNSGGSQLEYAASSSRPEIYVGLMWRTNPQFQGRQVGNKTFFIGGNGGSGVFLFGNSALVNGQAPLIFDHNTGTLDNSHVCAADLGLFCYPNVNSGIVTVGQWTKIEAYMRDSTTKTSRDGIVRWWINGVLAGNYTNLNLWAVGLNTWKWTETWDGTVNPVPTVDWSHFIDQLHISIPNCGAGCPVNPPSPPPPPPSTLGLSPTTQPAGTVGTAYSGTTVTASGGTAPYTFTVTGLPPGVTLSSSGVWGGTPTLAGTYSVVVTAKDSAAAQASGSQTYSVAINPGPVTITPATLPAGTVGTAYSQALSSSGGTAPYTYSVISGTLPAGITLSTGTLSGTPTTAGTYTFTIQSADSAGTPGKGTILYNFVINQAPPAQGGPVSVSVTWSDNSSNESGFEVWTSLNGASYIYAGKTAANTTSLGITVPSAALFQLCARVRPFRTNTYGADIPGPFTDAACKSYDFTIPAQASGAAVN